MNKKLVIFLFIIPIKLFANGELVCPDGAKEVTDKRIYKEKVAIIKACTDSSNKLNGTSLMIVDNQVIDKCNYTNNLENGTCLAWYFTGEKKTSTKFQNGKLHGEMISWYKNGVIEIQAFHNQGKAVGKWKYWNHNGELTNVIEHK